MAGALLAWNVTSITVVWRNSLVDIGSHRRQSYMSQLYVTSEQSSEKILVLKPFARHCGGWLPPLPPPSIRGPVSCFHSLACQRGSCLPMLIEALWPLYELHYWFPILPRTQMELCTDTTPPPPPSILSKQISLLSPVIFDFFHEFVFVSVPPPPSTLPFSQASPDLSSKNTTVTTQWKRQVERSRPGWSLSSVSSSVGVLAA